MGEKIIGFLRRYSGHKNIELTSRGNTAIFAALYCCRKLNPGKVLIPDQGGWITYPKYPKMLGMEAVEVRTDDGVVDLNDLKLKLDGVSCFLYCNPAGYFAEQPVKEIYDVCKGKCMVILDISGCIGDEDPGKYCDLSVGSFGKWKPVNVEYGGFVSAKDKKTFEIPAEIFNTTSFDNNYSDILAGKLAIAGERLKIFYERCRKIKEDLGGLDIIHRDRKGINVVVGFKDKAEKEKIIKYCDENGYEHTLCPRYIRVNRDAVSIEVKRL